LELLVQLTAYIRKTNVSDQQTATTREPELLDIAKRISKEGLSFEKLRNLVSLFGFQGGQPGRPTKDYSAEYELKAMGRTWREVAQHVYENDRDTRKEFGFSDFRQLTREQQFVLRNRVREGIRAYAEREGKPFPPRPHTGLLLPSARVQKKPR